MPEEAIQLNSFYFPDKNNNHRQIHKVGWDIKGQLAQIIYKSHPIPILKWAIDLR